MKYNKNINLDIILNNLNIFNNDILKNISLNQNITCDDICKYPKIKSKNYDLNSNKNITPNL